jgi:hypothetical protein
MAPWWRRRVGASSCRAPSKPLRGRRGWISGCQRTFPRRLRRSTRSACSGVRGPHHGDTTAREHVMELAEQEVLPSRVDFLNPGISSHISTVESTHVFGVLVRGVRQTRRGGSELRLAHENLALAVAFLDGTVRCVCTAGSVSATSTPYPIAPTFVRRDATKNRPTHRWNSAYSSPRQLGSFPPLIVSSRTESKNCSKLPPILSGGSMPPTSCCLVVARIRRSFSSIGGVGPPPPSPLPNSRSACAK